MRYVNVERIEYGFRHSDNIDEIDETDDLSDDFSEDLSEDFEEYPIYSVERQLLECERDVIPKALEALPLPRKITLDEDIEEFTPSFYESVQNMFSNH